MEKIYLLIILGLIGFIVYMLQEKQKEIYRLHRKIHQYKKGGRKSVKDIKHSNGKKKVKGILKKKEDDIISLDSVDIEDVVEKKNDKLDDDELDNDSFFE